MTDAVSLKVGVITVSDTRNWETDASGALLADFVESSAHRLHLRRIVPDDVSVIQDTVRTMTDSCDVILLTGGTGVTARDVTPEALEALITKPIPGFGELFRWLSYADIGAATIQSRALAGLCGKTIVFALPGSTGACRLAIEKIIAPQLDVRTRPCNFVQLMERLAR